MSVKEEDNRSAENNMENLLTKKMFTNYNSSLLRQNKVYQTFFVLYPV